MKDVIFEGAREIPLCWVSIAFRGGWSSDPIGLEGLSQHAFGAAAHTARRFAALERLGVRCSITSDIDAVVLRAVCLSRVLPEAWPMLVDGLASGIDDAAHRGHLGSLRAAIDHARESDLALAGRFFRKHVCPGHPYSRAGHGTARSLAKLTRELAAAELDLTATSGGAIAAFAGDIFDQPCDAMAAELDARLRAGDERPLADVSERPRHGRRLILVDKPGREQVKIRIGQLAVGRASPDLAPLTAVAQVLGWRLADAVREQRGWTYEASCRLDACRGPGRLIMSLEPPSELTADALVCAFDVFKQVCQLGVDADDMPEYPELDFDARPAEVRAARRLDEIVCDLPEGHHRVNPLLDCSSGDVRAAIDRHLRPTDLCVVVVCTADRVRDELERMAGWDDVVIEPYDSY